MCRVLLIDDDKTVREALCEVFSDEGIDCETCADASHGVARARGADFDVVITDLQMPGASGRPSNEGLEVVRALHKSKPFLPVILMTGHHSTETAIEATKAGAFDYLIKPVDTTELLHLMQKAATNKKAASEPVQLGATTPVSEAMVGKSRVMQVVYREIGRVAPTAVTVLIRGETGTGKELAARAIFQHSSRANQPFIVVNCAAVPETLLESELFGHEAGAFTDAKARRIGRFEQAHGGTIFLDEIGDMSLSTQVKLLRVLQERTIQRLGGKETIGVDVRVLAATHCNLDAAVEARSFRADLFFRINEAVIQLPALRDRLEDIPELAQYFAARQSAAMGAPAASFDASALQLLQAQSWPGNVRELENVVSRALLLARGQTLTSEIVQKAIAAGGPGNQSSAAPAVAQSAADANRRPFAGRVVDLLAQAQRGDAEKIEAILSMEAERELYGQAIHMAWGNQSQAARWLGVSRPTLREKLNLYGLQKDGGRANRNLLPLHDPQILVVEDDEAFGELLTRLLEEEGYEVVVAESVDNAISLLEARSFDAVLADLHLPGSDGLELVQTLRTTKPHLPVVLMTGQHSTDTAIAAIKMGAYDYFAKPDAGDFAPFQERWKWVADLAETLYTAVASKRAMERVGLPGDSSLGGAESSDRIVGRSRVMREVYQEIGRVAPSSATVLIRGETGTGKELVARAIYQHSTRAGQPFIVINCAAVPDMLLESELFGHEPGAFTDAKARRIGRFEQATGGTLFLDEIGDISLSTQVKLLRVLQEGAIQRLGGRETIFVDVRVLAATHRDLERAMQTGEFRPDLFFRINQSVIHLPPLRNRLEDIPELAGYFLHRDGPELGYPKSVLSKEAVDCLQAQSWPGNVRELRNAIRRSLLLAHGYPVSPEQILKALRPVQPVSASATQPYSEFIRDLLNRAKRGEIDNADEAMRTVLEEELYTQAIALAHGEQGLAARWLGVSRPTAREKLGRYGLAARTQAPPSPPPG